MESSRIFVKGLPPSITEADFKKHFSSSGREVTDARLFANRRIGYIGYKTPEDAQKAVKYFNKTFVRMSRIGVEVARPFGESNDRWTNGKAPTAPKESHSIPSAAPKVQDEGREESTEDDPKLKEYLEVMKPKSKKRAWENDAPGEEGKEEQADDDHNMVIDAEAASDDEYEQVPRKAKRAKVETTVEEPSNESTSAEAPQPDAPLAEETAEEDASKGPVSDADWVRSRTSRLLGLLDDDEEEEETKRPRAASTASSENEPYMKSAPSQSMPAPKAATPPPSNEKPDVAPAESDAAPTGVRASMRLFLRNLPYDVQEEALQAEFASYGNIEEVCAQSISLSLIFKMST